MKKQLSSIAVKGVCCVFFGFAAQFSAFAVERQWTGAGGDSLWETAANWSDSTVPTGTDAAVFDIGDGNALQVFETDGVTYPETIKVSSGAVCLGSAVAERYCSFSTLTGIVEVAQEACLIMSNRIEKSNQAIVKKGGGDAMFRNRICMDGGGTGCKFLDIQGGTFALEGGNGYLRMHATLEGYIRIRNGAVFSIPEYNKTSGNVNFIIDDGGVLVAGHSSGNYIKTIEMNGGTAGGNTVDASAVTYRTVPNARSGMYFRSSSGTPVAQRGGTFYLAKSPMQYTLLGGILAPTTSLESNAGATTENPSVFLLDGGLFAPSLNGGNINAIFNDSHRDRIVLKVGSNGARFGSINQEDGANLYVGLNIPLAAETENGDGGVTVEGRAIYRISKPFELTGDVRVVGGGVALVDSADTATTPQFFGAGSFALRNSALTYQQCSSDKGLQLATATGKGLAYEGGGMIRFRRANGGSSGGDFANNADNYSKQTLVSGPLSRTGKGSVLYLWDGVNQYVGADGASKYTVSGGVANGLSGAVAQPVIGTKNYDQTFLSYDADDGFKEFSGYASVSDATTSSSIVDITATATLSSSKAVGGLRMMYSDLSLSSGVTLSVGDGTNPAIVLLNNRSTQSTATIKGAGTLDFGTSEGLVALNRTSSMSSPARIDCTIAGSGGLSVVAPLDGGVHVLGLGGANVFTGGTFVNGAFACPTNSSAFSSGMVTLGDGDAAGGGLLMATEGLVVPNAMRIAGRGPISTLDASMTYGAVIFTKSGELSGNVEVYAPVRLCARGNGVRGTFSGSLSGDSVRLWSCTGEIAFSGVNTYTGGTAVVSSTLALSGNGTAGTGGIVLDRGTLRVENTAAKTIPNTVSGIGTLALAGSGAVTFSSLASEEGCGFALDVCGGERQLAGSLADIASITNSSSARGVLVVTSDGAWSGEVHSNVGIGVATGVRFLLGADATLPADARLYLADGATLDLDGETRTVRTVYGNGMVVNGTLNETNPRGGAILIVH